MTAIHRFAVGSIRCAVVTDWMQPAPFEGPLSMFYAPASGVSEAALADALAEEGEGRSTIDVGYNCLIFETASQLALIDTGLGPGFTGYGEWFTPLVGRLVRGVQDFGAADVTSVLFTHLHLDHVRGAVHSDDPTFPNAKHRAHSAEIAFSRSEAATHAVGGDAEEPRRAIARLGASLVGFGEAEAVMPGVHAVTSAGAHGGPHGLPHHIGRRVSGLRGRHVLRPDPAPPAELRHSV